MRMILLAAAAAAALASGSAAAAQPDGSAPAGRTGTADQPEESIEQLRGKAQAGDASAQNDLGAQLMGSKEPASQAEARLWFQRASDAGDVEARNNLSTMHLLGIGGPKDEALGRRMRDEAARLGSIGANLSIADRYFAGAEGYPRDPARGLDHLRAAANGRGGNATYAQWRLAMAHIDGSVTPRDPKEAYRLLAAASEAGGVSAMISRAVMLATGDGVGEDDAAARLWYERAANSLEVGFEHGLRGLGGMLATGEGGAVDLPRGVAFLRLAAAAGDEQAQQVLDKLQEQVTPEVDAEAQRIAEAWLKRHMPND